MATNITLPDSDPGVGNKTQGWLQSDKQAHTSMWQMGLKHPSALAVLHFMISKLQRGANGIVISSEALARQMDISQRTAKSATKILKDGKFVQVLKSGNSNVYIVNSKVAWQGHRGMRYASFNAQLLVDETEQLTSVEELEIENRELLEVPVMEMEFDIAAVSKPVGKKTKRLPANPQQDLL